MNMEGERNPEKPKLSEVERQRYLRRIAYLENEAEIETDEYAAKVARQTIVCIRAWIDE
jgi:hypothetical protein